MLSALVGNLTEPEPLKLPFPKRPAEAGVSLLGILFWARLLAKATAGGSPPSPSL